MTPSTIHTLYNGTVIVAAHEYVMLYAHTPLHIQITISKVGHDGPIVAYNLERSLPADLIEAEANSMLGVFTSIAGIPPYASKPIDLYDLANRMTIRRPV